MKTQDDRGMVAFIRNAFTTTRLAWLQRLLDPRRDIEQECGHPSEITTDDYLEAFERGDIASRVVKIYPEECWQDDPEVFETEDQTETAFEKKWIELQEQFQIYAALQRADILSGIGRFGIILLGFNDGLDLSQPVAAGSDRQLIYLRAFDESLVTVKELERNVTSPRYGMPVRYDIRFEESGVIGTPPGQQGSFTKTLGTAKTVDWTRVLHICDNRTNSDIFGLPRMKVVFNRLLDLKKIAGGSGEMFWKGGFPGIALEAPPVQGVSISYDKEATKAQMEDYMNGLQRYIALIGMQAKSLSPQVADPGPHLEAQIRLIAMALSIPWRILMGVEVGQLASEQDMRSWNRRVGRRRTKYVTPFIIHPLVTRLIDFGVLPKPTQVRVEWNDLNSPSDKDKAEVAEKMTNAITKYVGGNGDLLVPMFQFLTLVLNFTDEEANAIIKEVGDSLEEERTMDREAEQNQNNPPADENIEDI